MRIKVVDLPPPPPGQTGWPWTKHNGDSTIPAKDDAFYPRISIVTPSFNQGRFIEETIRSVLLQNYPNFEYIIIDGGSTDQTLDVIRKYDKWITCWVSEQDRGQSHALNKGFALATGNVLAYINSDDLYEAEALKKVMHSFSKSLESGLVVGSCILFDGDKTQRIIEPSWPDTPAFFLQPFGSPFAQPASFWSREAFERAGGFDESLNYVLDREFFLKLALDGLQPKLVPAALARYRDHPDTKTRQTIRVYQESIPVVHRHAAACGLTAGRRKALLKKIQNEIDYLAIFIFWKKYGRLPAMLEFFMLLAQSPNLIANRKVLGAGRRLLTYRRADVQELKNV